ncbi:hypothetical protein ACIOK4_24980 [Streptomyces bottropensis]|uniref:hypothetical protein n=1 Tax=Streptomyces bottropensis TaxID=42235 RepID=UPI00382691FC
MRVPTVNQPEEFFYFTWAIENLYATQGLVEFLNYASYSMEDHANHARLLIGKALEAETVPASRLAQSAGEPIGSEPWWTPQVDTSAPSAHMRYADLLEAGPEQVLSHPDSYYEADEQIYTPRLDDAAYRLMLTSFLGALIGDKTSIPWLGVLMLRGPSNRQLCISHFMTLVTRGKIGWAVHEIPSRTPILNWARTALKYHNPVEPTFPFPDIVRLYIELSRTGKS